MLLILYILKVIWAACSYSNFSQFQLKNDNFYQEYSYVRGNPYAFGVWTQFAPLRSNYYTNFSKSEFNQSGTLDGLHILNFQSDSKIYTLFYQKWLYDVGNASFIILLRTSDSIYKYTINQSNMYYEGNWVFTYFSFSHTTKYNIAQFNMANEQFNNVLVTNAKLSTFTPNARLEYGGQGQYKIGSSNYNLNIFPGRISIITTFEDSIQFFSNSDKAKFVQLISICSVPPQCQQEIQVPLLEKPCNQYNCTSYQVVVDNPVRFMVEFWLKKDTSQLTSLKELILSIQGLYQTTEKYLQFRLFWENSDRDSLLNHEFGIFNLPSEKPLNKTNIVYQLKKPMSQYNQWVYFNYEFKRTGVYQNVTLSIFYTCCESLIKYALLGQKDYQQYSNYNTSVSAFIGDTSDINLLPFLGMISNLKIRYCLQTSFQFSRSNNLACNPQCKTCRGPTKYDCASCYDEQNRYYQSDLKQCLCKKDYEENDNLVCIKNFLSSTLIDQSIYKEFIINEIVDTYRCKFGQFQVWQDKIFLGCIQCPYYNQKENKIQCLNCLLNSQNWYLNPVCDIEYQRNYSTFYSNKQLDYQAQELFIIYHNLMTVELCLGCEKVIENRNPHSVTIQVSQQKKIFQCKSFFYSNNNQCKLCASNCIICRDEGKCIECNNQYYLENFNCFLCPTGCSQCTWNNEAQNAYCSKCLDNYALVNQECKKCSFLCVQCENRINKNNGKEYLKCLKCSHNAYISLDGESCYLNTQQYCIYPFQFSIINPWSTTVSYKFQPEELQNIRTGCILCSPLSYLEAYDQKFYCTLSSPALLDDYKGCISLFYDKKQNKFQCMVGIKRITSYPNIGYCDQNIPFCQTCYFETWELTNYCQICDDGYYNDYYTTYCKPCPSECLLCIQSDSSKIRASLAFLVLYKLFEQTFAYFNQFNKDPDSNVLNIICSKCADGYILHFDKCIEACPYNCKECEIQNEQQICISCVQLSDYYQQIYNGRCILCPQNCQLCHPRNQNEKSSINPFFDNKELDYFSHSCIQPLYDGLYFDEEINQFLKCGNSIHQCKKEVIIDIYIYCNQIDLDKYLNQFNQDQKLTQEKFHILLDNLNFDQFERHDYFLYLNLNFVKRLTYNLHFNQNSICQIKQGMQIYSNLQKNCFNLIELKINLDGANSTLNLNGLLIIQNFNSIKIQRFNFYIQKGAIKINNIIGFKIQFQKILIFQDLTLNNLNDYFISIVEVSELELLDIQIFKLNVNFHQGLFLINSQNSLSRFYIAELNINNSKFNSSFIFNINSNQFSQNEISKIKIYNSEFTNSNLIQYLSINQILTINEIFIQDSNISKTDGFLNLILFQNIEIYGLQILNSLLENSVFILCSKIFILKQFQIEKVQIISESSIFSNLQSSNLEMIYIQDGKFIDNIYSNKDTFILFQNPKNLEYQVLFDKIHLINNSFSISSNQDSFQQDTEQSIIQISATTVIFDNFIIQRGLGYSEFTIKETNTFKFYNSIITLHEKYQFKTLFNNQECSLFPYDKFMYNNLLKLFDISNIDFFNNNITNLIVFDQVLFEIQILSNMKTQCQIIQCHFESNIIHQYNIDQKISLISINSNFKFNFKLNYVIIQKNLLSLLKESNPRLQSLSLIVDAQASIVQITNSKFLNNININGLGSNLYIDSDKISLENTTFYNNSIFYYDTFKQFLRWGLSLTIYQDDLLKLYPIESLGGNGNFKTKQMIINNIHLEGSQSKQGAAFVLTMQEQGVVQIKNSIFQNLQVDLKEPSKGGAFYISTQSQYLSIKVENTSFTNITARKAGSIFYIIPSTQEFSIVILNSNFENIYSIQGGLLYIEQSIHLNQILEIQNCSLIQTDEQFFQFINNLPQLSNNELNDLTKDYSFVFCYKCSIQIKDFSIENYLYIPWLQLIGNINLANISIINTIFSNKLLSLLSGGESDQIIVSNLVFRNCTQIRNIDIIIPNKIQTVIQSDDLVTQCDDNLQYAPPMIYSQSQILSNINQISFLDILLKEELQQPITMMLFKGLEVQNNIRLFNIILDRNACNQCQRGLIFFDTNQLSRISINQITVFNSKCGLNGCISFYQTQINRLLSNLDSNKVIQQLNTSIYISELYCNSNEAKYGGCLYFENSIVTIQSSLIFDNQAIYGGAIYTKGYETTLVSIDLRLINNTAQYGSAIYTQERLKRSLKGIEFINNKGLNQIEEQPSLIALQTSPHEFLIPRVIVNTQSELKTQFYSEKGDQAIFYVPTGMEISKYKKFDIDHNLYKDLNLSMRFFAINSQQEIVRNLSNTHCELKIENLNKEIEQTRSPKLNKYLIEFNQTTYSYNLDDLIFYIPQDSVQTYSLYIRCNSIFIPNLNKQNNQIEGYHQNYVLILLIKPYECQLGEYSENRDDYCHQCRVDQQQYSVTLGATQCQKVDDYKIQEITQAQIFLRKGFWRKNITTSRINLCFNKRENCQGGWGIGNDLCKYGYLGTLCEQCDNYNVQGNGHYQRFNQFDCQFCENSKYSQLINFIIIIIIFTIMFIICNYLAHRRMQKISLNIFLFKQPFICYCFRFNEVLLGQIIKIIILYFQIISLTQELNSYFTDSIQQFIKYFGNPFTLLVIYDDCQLTQIDTNLNIIYLQILQNLICLLILIVTFVIIIYIYLHFFGHKLRRLTTYINFIYLLFLFVQNSFLRQIASLIGFRVIQDEYWIYKNITYNYFNNIHLKIVLICLLPILICIGIFLPLFLLRKQGQTNFLIGRQQFKQLGFWFSAYSNTCKIWESYKLIILNLLTFILILINIGQSLRGMVIYLQLIIYTRLFQDSNVYYNKNLNKFENQLLIISTLILISCIFSPISEELVGLLNNGLFIVSLIVIVYQFWIFSQNTLAIIFCSVLEILLKGNENNIQYKIFQAYTKVAIQRRKTRFELLRAYLKQKSKKQLIIKKIHEQF